MLQPTLFSLFSFDEPFSALRLKGFPGAVESALTEFWALPAFQPLAQEAGLPPGGFSQLSRLLDDLGSGKIRPGTPALWREILFRSEELAGQEPLAGALNALIAFTAWCGGMGEHLYFQSFEGHHPGWHEFPLVLSQRLLEAGAVWTARFLADHASQFIEAAKMAYFDPALQKTIGDFRTVLARAQDQIDESERLLAWELQKACRTDPPNFRAETAALLWSLGDVVRAERMRAGGPNPFIPSLPVLLRTVQQAMATLARDSLVQYILLEMKDLPPFNLREHSILFGQINARFHNSRLNVLDEFLPTEPSRLYAQAAIAWFGGKTHSAQQDELLSLFASFQEMLENEAPTAFLRLGALSTLLDPGSPAQAMERWEYLAQYSARILARSSQLAIDFPFGRIMDIPFYYLPGKTQAEVQATLDAVETYRSSNLGYWLAVTPPSSPPAGSELADLLAEETRLLDEMRGARFIRLLKDLPLHYRRYGADISQFIDQPGEAGEKGGAGSAPKRPDPFDEATAREELIEAHRRLDTLYTAMEPHAPEYAALRRTNHCPADEFLESLAWNIHEG